MNSNNTGYVNREHSFDVELAGIVGVLGAVLLKNFAYWQKRNAQNLEGYFLGMYWARETTRSLVERYPYMERSALRRELKSLEKDGWLITFSPVSSGKNSTTMYAVGPLFLAWNYGLDWRQWQQDIALGQNDPNDSIWVKMTQCLGQNDPNNTLFWQFIWVKMTQYTLLYIYSNIKSIYIGQNIPFSDLLGNGHLPVAATKEAPTPKAKKEKSGVYTQTDVAKELASTMPVQAFYAELLNREIWQEFLQYRKDQHNFSYSGATYEAKAVKELYDLAKGKTDTAKAIVNKTISNGWRGLFSLKEGELKDSTNAQRTKLFNNGC